MDDHQNPRFDVAAGITFMPGAYVEPGAVIEENVYIGPNAVILSNGAGTEGSTIIRKGVEIGCQCNRTSRGYGWHKGKDCSGFGR